MVFDEPISLKCLVCGNNRRLCCNPSCETRICSKCDTYFNPKKYYFYCMDCKILTCKTCFEVLNKCNNCNIIHCTKCDDGDVIENSWDCIDIFQCHNCRNIKVDELYNYFCEKYNESLQLEDIRKIILKTE